MNLSAKLLKKVDELNKEKGTNYELAMDYFQFTPFGSNHFPEVSSGTFYIGKFKVLNYKRMRRNFKNKVYGITTGRLYTAIHFRKLVLHINLPWLHGNNIQQRYYLKGIDKQKKLSYSHNEMKQLIEDLSQ